MKASGVLMDLVATDLVFVLMCVWMRASCLEVRGAAPGQGGTGVTGHHQGPPAPPQRGGPGPVTSPAPDTVSAQLVHAAKQPDAQMAAANSASIF